jgi:hypothetical protein
MASTPEGRRLTESHRQAQQDVRDDFLAEFAALWALLDTARLDETGPGWVRSVLRVVAAYRLLSSQVASEYFWRFDAVEAPELTTSRPPGPSAPPAGPSTGRPPRADRRESASPRARREQRRRRPRGEDVIPQPRRSNLRWDVDEDAIARSLERPGLQIEIPEIDWSERDRAVEVSLNITGPIGQKSKIGRGKTPERARDESFVQSAGLTSRHVLTGGRESLLRLIEGRPTLLGYIRVTDGDPCYFCAMLASRGPVYRTPNRASFEAHDHCACTAEPVYATDTAWPGRSREFEALWNENIRNRYSGKEAIREWRRLYDRLRREERRAA